MKFRVIICLFLSLLLVACSDEPASTNVPELPPGSATASATKTRVPLTATPVGTPTPTAIPTNTPAPTPTAAPPLVKGGNVTGGLINDAVTLHPFKRNNESGQQFLGLLFSASLTRRDANTLAVVPNAAASWNVSRNDLTVTFKLKDNLKWSDGQPLTSADYLWTYEQLKKPENAWPYAASAFANSADANSEGIENITAPDLKTLVVKLKTASFDMVSQADVIEPLPKQIWQGKDWNDAAKNPEINKPSVVSGPWLLKEWKPGERIVFAANPNSSIYPRPNLDTLTFQILPDSATALQRIKSGEIDFFTPEIGEQGKFENLPNVQNYRWTPARTTWQYLGFNFRKPHLQDKALRQAMAYVVDRTTIIEKLASGLGRPLYSDVVSWHPYFVPNVPRYDFNPSEAQKVLREAQYYLSADRLTAKTATALPNLKLVYNGPSALREGIANLIKQSFGTLGITVETSVLDYNNYQSFLTNPASDYDLFLGGWTTDLDPEQFGTVWQNIPQLNNGSFGNEKLTNLYSAAQKEPDAAKRKDLMAQVQRLEAEELPYLYLYAQLGWLNVNKRIAGFTTTPLGPTANLYTDWFAVK